MSFYMATTSIGPQKTAMEISSLLSKFGASQILTTFEAGEIVGLSFLIKKGHVTIPFRLPIKWEPVLAAMKAEGKTTRSLCVKEQAVRVAWRIIYRWIQAQLALVETGSAELEEIFLPYAQTKNGATVYELYCDNQFKQLSAPRE